VEWVGIGRPGVRLVEGPNLIPTCAHVWAKHKDLPGYPGCGISPTASAPAFPSVQFSCLLLPATNELHNKHKYYLSGIYVLGREDGASFRWNFRAKFGWISQPASMATISVRLLR